MIAIQYVTVHKRDAEKKRFFFWLNRDILSIDQQKVFSLIR